MPADKWEDGQAYEAYMGRWSRLVAGEFLDWLKVPEEFTWLDVGCGTGQLATAILDRCAPIAVRGIDPSRPYVRSAEERMKDSRTDFCLGDALNMPFRDDSFDITVSGLVLNFISEPAQGLKEQIRVTRPGGLLAGYVWDYAGDMQPLSYFWHYAEALNPGARDFNEGRRFPLCKPDPLRELFEGAQLVALEVQAIDIPARFREFDDYWSPFLGSQGPAPGYVASLGAAERQALRERLRSVLPTKTDGSIELMARAWAVKGRKNQRRSK